MSGEAGWKDLKVLVSYVNSYMSEALQSFLCSALGGYHETHTEAGKTGAPRRTIQRRPRTHPNA